MPGKWKGISSKLLKENQEDWLRGLDSVTINPSLTIAPAA
jgi:hypothetical protein